MINKIRLVRKSKGMTLTEVAELANTTAQHISRLEKKDSIDTKWVDILSKIFNVKPSDLVELNDTDSGVATTIIDLPKCSEKPIPVISWVHAGDLMNVPPDQIYDEYVTTSINTSDNAFGLIVSGDSMEPRFFEEDIIIVDPLIMPKTGDYCVAMIYDEATFKIFQKETDEHIILKPINPKHASLLIEKHNGTEFHFVGKVVDMKPKL